VRTPVCDLLGIEFPLLAFSHTRDVVAAATNAGGFGVRGAMRFDADELEVELRWDRRAGPGQALQRRHHRAAVVRREG
jgi:hypothetical protein